MCFFFFNDTATTEIYTLSLHDALPIYEQHGNRPKTVDYWAAKAADGPQPGFVPNDEVDEVGWLGIPAARDRKSTRLNSSHGYISYAVFCLKKKKTTHLIRTPLSTPHPH